MGYHGCVGVFFVMGRISGTSLGSGGELNCGLVAEAEWSEKGSASEGQLPESNCSPCRDSIAGPWEGLAKSPEMVFVSLWPQGTCTGGAAAVAGPMARDFS